jgi:hypothetical protein
MFPKMLMKTINTKIDEQIFQEFRDVVYKRTGLKRGEFTKSVEEAMLDYILKYSKSDSAKAHAKRMKEKSAQAANK